MISIIVPVYNSERYLTTCLNSIISQTFSEFELILVNDGSTDNSFGICRFFSIQDNRIRLIDKSNGGVSSARNIGIREAVGQFITFIDSDDYVKADYLKQLVENIGIDCDLIQSGLSFFTDGTKEIIGAEKLPEYDNLQRSIVEDCFTMATLPLITSPVAKLYRASIIKKENIYFDEQLSYGEDRDFNLRFINVAKTAKSISYCGYLYRKELLNSLSSNRDYLKMLDIDLQYWNNLRDYLEKNKCASEKVITYLADRLFNIYNDRLLQYAKSDISFRRLSSVVKEITSSWAFKWLHNHMEYANANVIVKRLYLSGYYWIITAYLQII